MKRAAIIGAGHNGLVAACYLAKAGIDVTVFERRHIVGGLAATEELFPGIRASSLASWHGMFRREIIDELKLEKYGLQGYTTPYISTHFPNGDTTLFNESLRNDASYSFFIDGLKDRDKKAWNAFWSELGKASKILNDHLFDRNLRKDQYLSLLSDAGLTDVADSIFTQSAVDFCARRFESDSVISASANMNFDHPCRPGSLFEIVFLGTANAFGRVGQWGFAKSGLGSISFALEKAAVDLGVKIYKNAPVLNLQSGPSIKVTFKNNSSDRSDFVLSSADPASTAALQEDNLYQDYKAFSSKAIIHLKLSALPEFPSFKKIGRIGPHAYKGAIDLRPTLQSLKTSYNKISSGKFPGTDAIISSHFPTACDDSINPSGKSHLWSLFHHAVPPIYNDGDWNEQAKKEVLDATLSIARMHAPSIDNLVEDVKIITPTDIIDTYSVSTAGCSHLPMTQFFEDRASYRGLMKNVYLCGAGTPANGTVTGLSGYHAAHLALEDLGIRSC